MEHSTTETMVTITVDDKQITVPEGIPVASAVMGYAHGGKTYTHPITEEPRAPYCLMGVCFECLMEIDGKADVQSCLVAVHEGMIVRRQL